MHKKLLKGFLLIIALMITLPQFAHQKKEAVTRIVFNQRTTNIEIMHRFLVHDAEHASKVLFGTSLDILSNTFAQKHFADYVAKNFSLKSLADSELPLSDVGFEIEGNFIWVYQETPWKPELKGLKVTQSAFIEVWPEQTNLVNIERGKKVESLVFKGTADEQQVSFSENSLN